MNARILHLLIVFALIVQSIGQHLAPGGFTGTQTNGSHNAQGLTTQLRDSGDCHQRDGVATASDSAATDDIACACCDDDCSMLRCQSIGLLSAMALKLLPAIRASLPTHPAGRVPYRLLAPPTPPPNA